MTPPSLTSRHSSQHRQVVRRHHDLSALKLFQPQPLSHRAAEDLFEVTSRLAYSMMAHELFPRFCDAVKDHANPESVSARFGEDTQLKDMLGDEKAVLLFSEYCKIHHCEEQVLFWLEAHDHKLLFDPQDMVQQGERLYELYLDPAKSESLINISERATKDIRSKLDSGKVDRELLATAMAEVEMMLELDVWPRYKDAVVSGEHNPTQGKADIVQHEEEDEATVNMSQPSKAAVKWTLKKPADAEKLRRAALRAGCAEMVDYCRDCQEYEKLFSDMDRLNKAAAINRRYLMSGCDSPVNIPDTQLKAIQKGMESPSPLIFKKSYEEVVKLLSDNVYANYLEMLKEEAAASAAMAPGSRVGNKNGPGGCCILA